MPKSSADALFQPLVGYRSRKAAQLCAHFALKAGACGIEKLKLIKLVYLSERMFLSEYYMPMLYDELYSLPNGPICSSTLNGIDGHFGDCWSDFISKNGNVIFPNKSFSRDDLDEISNAELAVTEKVWKEFGRMTASQIRNYTHLHCAEYTEIQSGRIPISYKEILEALGAPEAEDVDSQIAATRRQESVLSG